MSLRVQPRGSSISFVAIFFAGMGGIYFGLFSCGAYVWEVQVYWGLSAVLVVLVLALSPFFLGTWSRRIVFVLFYLVAFTLFQAAAMPFYPAVPESFAEYRHHFMLALEYGPCP